MGSLTIRLDLSLYSREAVARAAHRYTERFHVALRVEEIQILVQLTARDGAVDTRDLSAQFQDDVLDEQLRELVRGETREIHHQLIAAALREATPQGAGALP